MIQSCSCRSACTSECRGVFAPLLPSHWILVVQGAAEGNESDRLAHCGVGRSRLLVSVSEYDGSERMTGIGWHSVRVSERLRAVCLPFSVLREASVRRGTESWDLVWPAGHPSD